MDAVKDKVVDILVENFGLNEEKVKKIKTLKALVLTPL